MAVNPKSIANLNPKARYMGKVRFNTTLRPETITWLQSGGNASQRIEDLVTAAKNKDLKFSDPTSDPTAASGSARTENNADQEMINRLTAEIDRLKKENAEMRERELKMIDISIVNYIEDEIQGILDKNKRSDKGFRTNGFGEGIKKLRSLLVDLS